MPEIIDEIQTVLEKHGTADYSETVNQLEHALQCAALAEQEEGRPPVVAAALLHDIGHMLYKFGKDPAARSIDDRHEHIGAGWLQRHFGPDVAEPVRLHVDATRYLCATDPAYHGILSAGSVRSLNLQGGPFSPEEAQAFKATGFAEQAIALRRWDDRAKVCGLTTPERVSTRSELRICTQ